MSLKYVYSVLISFVFAFSSFGQNPKIEWLNDSIDYDIFVMSSKLLNDSTFIPRKYIVQLDLNEDQIIELKELSNSDWLFLINDENSRWATNLVLYMILKKDAKILRLYTPTNWKEMRINKDLEFWEHWLNTEPVEFENI